MGQDIKREFAKHQITRMGQLNGFPKDFPAAVAELVDALLTAPTEEIAKDVVSSFMEGANAETRCPFPSDIRGAVTARLEEFRPDPACPKCQDGWIIVERGGMSGAEKCDCWARRPAPDYRKMPGSEPIGGMLGDIAAAAKKLGGKG